jgi:hypothetical protein
LKDLENDQMTTPDQQDHPRENDQTEQDAQQSAARISRSSDEDRSRMFRHRIGFWGVLPVVALIALGGLLISLTSGGARQSGADGSSGAASASTAGNSGGTANPAVGGTAQNGARPANGKGSPVISAAKLAANNGALSLPSKHQALVISWQSGVGGRDLAAVSSQLGAALQAGGIRQYVSMKHACTQLAASVATAKAGPEIPDAAMQTLYGTALGQLSTGAAHCLAAISISPDGDETDKTNVDRTTLNSSVSEMSAGATSLFRATAEIQIASRQHR